MALKRLSDVELAELADELARAMPQLDKRGQRVAVELYRLLAEGEPVPEDRVAKRSGIPRDETTAILGEWPGVYRNEAGEIVGFWGLAQPEFPPHEFEVDGKRLWTWCSWDSLFIPVVLARTARVESVCAATGEKVQATVGPDGVEDVSPARAVISFLRPQREFDHDVILSFCHHVLFFSSEEAGSRWAAGREHVFLLSLDQGFELGRLVVEAKFGAVVRCADAGRARRTGEPRPAARLRLDAAGGPWRAKGLT